MTYSAKEQLHYWKLGPVTEKLHEYWIAPTPQLPDWPEGTKKPTLSVIGPGPDVLGSRSSSGIDAYKWSIRHSRWGGSRVMVWGGISEDHRTPLVCIDGNLTLQRYIDHILEPTFQQDNVRHYSARITTDYMNTADINVLQWPAFSPDLSTYRGHTRGVGSHS